MTTQLEPQVSVVTKLPQNGAIVSAARRAREIPLRAKVEFTQFGITLAGRVVGISHDNPMRYDLRLEDGAIISNITEPAIGALIALPWRAPSH